MPYTAVFTSPSAYNLLTEAERTFDVTPEIEALGGSIPTADTHGSDLLQYAMHAPEWVKQYRGKFAIEVKQT